MFAGRGPVSRPVFCECPRKAFAKDGLKYAEMKACPRIQDDLLGYDQVGAPCFAVNMQSIDPTCTGLKGYGFCTGRAMLCPIWIRAIRLNSYVLGYVVPQFVLADQQS